MEKSQPFIEKDKSVSDKCCANQHLSLERLQAYLQFLRRSYDHVEAKTVRTFEFCYLMTLNDMGRCDHPVSLLDDAEEGLKQGRYEEAERKLKEVDNLLRKAKKFGMLAFVVLIVIMFVGGFVVVKYGK